jgi:hypothetical protein
MEPRQTFNFNEKINRLINNLNLEYHSCFIGVKTGKAYVGKKDSINARDNFIKSAKLGDKEAREMLKKHCIKKKKK